jgi:hypothetical protein
MSKSPITCHGGSEPLLLNEWSAVLTDGPVLDASVGKPAAGVRVSLDVLIVNEAGHASETGPVVPKTLASG